MSRGALVAKALASELQAAPGERYDYSNAGYSLLGAIVEKASGQPYEAFLQQQLLKPAGMTKTGYVYQRGAQVFENVWQGAKTALIRRVEGLGGGFFVAAGGKELFSYSPRSQQSLHIDVELAADGKVSALLIHGRAGDLQAVRQ